MGLKLTDTLKTKSNIEITISCGEDEELKEYINKWWKRKAIRRYTKLHEENRLKPEILYYSDILNMTWDACKEKYLGEVGR